MWILKLRCYLDQLRGFYLQKQPSASKFSASMISLVLGLQWALVRGRGQARPTSNAIFGQNQKRKQEDNSDIRKVNSDPSEQPRGGCEREENGEKEEEVTKRDVGEPMEGRLSEDFAFCSDYSTATGQSEREFGSGVCW